MPQHVIVGLSGGVDSAVTAHLLQKQGYRVTAVFMQNWEAKHNEHCSAEVDLADARAVADQLGIPLLTVNFAQAYWDKVFAHCLDEFARGRTPNPDILCNREIKFATFLDYAKELGGDRIATGHYARIEKNNGCFELHKGLDANKDQSYFLYALNQAQLGMSDFPLGTYCKPEIRAIAQQLKLHNATKKDSTGICFIGENKFKPFLKNFLLAQPGKLVTPEGRVVGTHDGVLFYTLGQRKGLNIGGVAGVEEGAWYVVDKNVEKNELVVDQHHACPLLYHDALLAEDVHWIAGTPPDLPLRCHAKTRYRQADQACTVSAQHDGRVHVQFEQAQRAITPGQSVVFYAGTQCLGGAIIAERMHASPASSNA